MSTGSISGAVELLRHLAAGEVRSGEHIAGLLGCSRAAVWKRIEALRGLGIAVEAVPGLGYRLSEPVELLDAGLILEDLPAELRANLSSLEVHASLDSTNAELMRRAPGELHAVALFAERQTAGRGRRGRQWASPLARNLYFSLGWRFECGVGDLSALPLLLAVAAGRSLEQLGLNEYSIKWPNDLLLGGRKLGGCLVEVHGDAGGPCSAVLGIGINVSMPQGLGEAAEIDQPWTDLAGSLDGVSRNALASALLSSVLACVLRFEHHGFAPFIEQWDRRDALSGREIEVNRPGSTMSGRAMGVNRHGSLLLETEAGPLEVSAGEASLRRVS